MNRLALELAPSNKITAAIFSNFKDSLTSPYRPDDKLLANSKSKAYFKKYAVTAINTKTKGARIDSLILIFENIHSLFKILFTA